VRIVAASTDSFRQSRSIAIPTRLVAARKAHPGILVDDLDTLVDSLCAAGQDVSWDGDFPGYRRLYAHDPFGNRLEFLQVCT